MPRGLQAPMRCVPSLALGQVASMEKQTAKREGLGLNAAVHLVVTGVQWKLASLGSVDIHSIPC